MFDLRAVRRAFPLLSGRVNSQPLVYLDNAATTQKPRQMIDALTRFYKTANSNVHRGAHGLARQATADFEAVRAQVAKLLNAPHPEEVIWTRGATEAVNLIAQSYGRWQIRADDVLLVSQMEHHANLVPWQQLAQATGARVIPVPLTAGLTLDLTTLQTLLTRHKPRLLAITHASNALGVINPIAQICQLAKATQTLVVVDGAQAIAHETVDVQALGCDFYLFSAHKCYGPTGLGVLWGRKDLLQAMPPWQGGGEMIDKVSFSGTTYNRLPYKFEAGTPPVAQVIAFGSTLTYLDSLDRAQARQHEQQLYQYATSKLADLPGIKLLLPKADNVGILSLLAESAHPQDLAALLDEAGIAVRAGHHCAMPLMEHLNCTGTLRLSLAFYNTQEEIDYFCKNLNTALRQLQADQPSPVPPAEPRFIHPPAYNLLQERLLNAPGWQARVAVLAELGNSNPPLPEQLCQDENRISGCESAIWLHAQIDKDNHWQFALYSDARLMNGVLYLLLSLIQKRTAQEITRLDFATLLENCRLERFLTPSRSSGLQALLTAIHTRVLEIPDESE